MGRGLKGKPIKLQHSPDATGTSGHYVAYGSAGQDQASGTNNCMYDAAVAQLGEKERADLGISTGQDLRNRVAQSFRANPTGLSELSLATTHLRYTNAGALRAGGGLLANTADGLLAAQAWLQTHPKLAAAFANTGKLAGAALWLKNFTPVGLVTGLAIDYGYDQLLAYMDDNVVTAQAKLSAFLQSKDADLTPEKADFLAATTIKFLQGTGRVATHGAASRGFGAVSNKFAPKGHVRGGNVGIKVGEYTITSTVANSLATRPYINSPSTIANIMQSGKGVPDAFFKGGVNYKVPGTFNGSKGIFELGINPETNTIYHFLFKRTK